MRLTFGGVGHIALVLERPQDGEDGGVRQLVVERIADLGDGARAALPEHGHDVELAVGKGDVHSVAVDRLATNTLVDTKQGARVLSTRVLVDIGNVGSCVCQARSRTL